MVSTNRFLSVLRNLLLFVSIGLCAVPIMSVAAETQTAKKVGNLLVKFVPGVSEAKIQEVADYYGAIRIDSLGHRDAESHSKPELWRILKFEGEFDLKDIARRIVQDNRVDLTD